MGTKLASCLMVLALVGSASAELIGYWQLNEGTGTTATDRSGNGNDGTLVGPPQWAEGFYGGALQFNGQNNYVEIPASDSLKAQSEVTVAAWVNWANAGDTWLCILANGQQNGPWENYGLFVNRTSRFAYFTLSLDNAHVPQQTPNNTIVPDRWQHLCGTWDGSTARIYVDGELRFEQAKAGALTSPGLPLRLGHRNGSSHFYSGLVDEVAVFNHALTQTEIQEAMLGITPAELASDPRPEDAATDVARDSTLGWTPGRYAATHDVYFGTGFDDVNDASRGNPMDVLAGQGQAAAEFTPAELEYGQTYYWRIDEVNAVPTTIFKGEVWSFTTEPFAYPITSVTATASSFQPTMGPENTVNGSGLNADDQHSTLESQMWMISGAMPAWIQYEFDKVYKLHELWVWNSNQSIESFLGFGARNVAIEYSEDGQTWTALEDVPEFAQAGGTSTYTANTQVDLGGVLARFVKLTITSNWGGIAQQTGLSEVRFFHVPVRAFYPQPADEAASVSVATDLDWRPGREATSHTVYIGTDANAVAEGLVAGNTVSNHGYTPTDLLLATEYFWKVNEVNGVNEVNDAATRTVWEGDIWSFTTEPYAVIDDFESYDDNVDAETTVWHAWIDGLTDGKSGSQVGYDMSPFAEKTIIHGGSQSMPLKYDNASFAFSEATRTFDAPQDWTAHGARTLSVHFAGTAGNGGQLYLKINNTKMTYDGDAADLARTGWQPWNIDLSTVGNVGSVRSLTIGIEGAGAAGMLYVDDIRLSSQTPEFTTPAEPGTANLIARYSLDGNVTDSSGKGRNGTANGGPTYVAGVDGQALHLDGTDDFIVVGSVGISGAAPRTIAGWVKADTTTITDWTNLFGFTSSPNSGDALSFDMNKRGGTNEYCIHVYGWERSILAIDLEWRHLAATYDGTTVAWYGDGRLIGSETWVLNTQDHVQMGKRGHASGGNFPGALDEVRIYDKALSTEEIAWLAGRKQPVHKPL